MRILYVITLSELGGAQTVVANLANGLSKDHEVFVVAGDGDGKFFDLLLPEVKYFKIKHLVRKISPLKDFFALYQLYKINKKLNPDVIHLHSSKAGFLGRRIFPSDKIVYTVHGFDSIRKAHPKFLQLERRMQDKCAAIVAVSNYDKELLNQENIINNVHTIYNGIEKQPSQKENQFITDGKSYRATVLCIARLAPPKNHRLFIEVADHFPEYRFVWIGNNKKPAFKFPANVYFLGNIHNAAGYIEYADLFFLPSDFEGMPVVVIEAMANGVPIVASAVGGIPEMLDASYGEAVDNNKDSMIKAVSRWLTLNEEETEAAKIAAIKAYESKFKQDRMLKSYLDLYKSLNLS